VTSDQPAGGWSAKHKASADFRFLDDFSKWGSLRLLEPARILLGAFDATDAREEKKAYAAQILELHRQALEMFGSLCHGVSSRGKGPVVLAILSCTLEDCRGCLRSIRHGGKPSLTGMLSLPQTEAGHGAPAEVVGADAEAFLLARARGAVQVAGFAAQSSLFQFYDPSRGHFLPLSSGRDVAELKTGASSDLHSESNSAFLLIDVAAGAQSGAPDLLAVVAPTVPKMLRRLVAEIEIVSKEASATAAYVGWLAASGALHGVAAGLEDRNA